MNEIEKEALALLNEVAAERGVSLPLVTIDRGLFVHEALCRAIEQHEAYKQEVSDAVEMISNTSVSDNVWRSWVECILEKFILPKPTVDPLIEALTKAGWGMPETNAKELRAALGAVGFKIVEVER